MNSESTVTIKNSFFIENILSKPHKKPVMDNQCNSESASTFLELTENMPTFTSNKVILKQEPMNGLLNDELLGSHDDLDKINRNQHNFTSPDSSGCEEDNGDNLSDITTSENSEYLKKHQLFILDNKWQRTILWILVPKEIRLKIERSCF